ncbi:MAG: hypothetical protein RLY86_670 [Pseudomonadota bacterium]|jgi:hypothetical protein
MGELLFQDGAAAGGPAKRRGHAWTPGSGPVGETCGTCGHRVRVELSKTYQKCGLMHRHWTRARGTDVRCRDAACREWTPCQTQAEN